MEKINIIKRSYLVMLAMLIAALTTYTLYSTEAQASGNWNEHPEKFTLLADTPFYDAQSSNSEAVGVLSAFQSVQVAVPDGGENYPNSTEGAWYRVRTWLGEKWLRSGPAIVKESYYPVYMEVTFTDTEDMYDLPREDKRNGSILSPQTVTAIGQIFFCTEGVPEATQPESARCRPWYLVPTYLGEKWISPANAIEHYEDKQALAAFTPSSAAHQEKFRSSMRDLEPLLTKLSVEMVSLNSENGISRLEVRRLYSHREKLNDDEVEVLKNSIFKAVGDSFPLSVTTFTLSDKADLVGKILSIDKTIKRVLVVNYDKRTGKEDASPEAYWIRLSDDSNIHRNGLGLELSLDDLRIGQTVGVWKARMTLMTYPGQTTAYEIAIVEDAKPDEGGIPLSTILGLDLTYIDKIELDYRDGTPIVIRDHEIIQAITERMQHIRLQAANQYPENGTYKMTLYQADRKAIYSGNLILQQLPYSPTSSTVDLDEFIHKLKSFTYAAQ